MTGLTAAACAATLEFVFRRKQLAVQWMIDIAKHKALLAGFGLHLLITTSLLMFAACMVCARNPPIWFYCGLTSMHARQWKCLHSPIVRTPRRVMQPFTHTAFCNTHCNICMYGTSTFMPHTARVAVRAQAESVSYPCLLRHRTNSISCKHVP